MHVLICPDRMGALTSAQAARALATGWPGAELRPVGEAGQGFLEATADRWRTEIRTAVWDGLPVEWSVADEGAVLRVAGPQGQPPEGSRIPYDASSLLLGRAITTLVTSHRPPRLLVDLTGLRRARRRSGSAGRSRCPGGRSGSWVPGWAVSPD